MPSDKATVPGMLGFGVIAGIQWRKLNYPDNSHMSIDREQRRWQQQLAESAAQSGEGRTGKDEKHRQQRGSASLSREEAALASPRQLSAIALLPTNALSRAWGALMSVPVPLAMRIPVFRTWAAAADANLSEAARPLAEYGSLSALVARKLRPGVRLPIPRNPLAVTAPVDGVVTACGCCYASCANSPAAVGGCGPLGVEGRAAQQSVFVLEQVKGVRFRLEDLLGELPACALTASSREKGPVVAAAAGTATAAAAGGSNGDSSGGSSLACKSPGISHGCSLYYINIYLPAGACHRVHSPADWAVARRRHFAGELHAVAPWAARLLPSLLATNERVVLAGSWVHGFMAVVAVGGLGTGSIGVAHEEDEEKNTAGEAGGGGFCTNVAGAAAGECCTRHFAQQWLSARGEEVAHFERGSTVVVVFEAPADFEFDAHVGPGTRVAIGDSLGRITGRHGSDVAALLARRTTYPSVASIALSSSKQENTQQQKQQEEAVRKKACESDGIGAIADSIAHNLKQFADEKKASASSSHPQQQQLQMWQGDKGDGNHVDK